jgi:hypothetical protein
MYGTRLEENHIIGYWSAYTGEYHQPKLIPAGYTGLIQGSIYREDNGLEITDEQFLEQPADYFGKLVLHSEDQTLGQLLHFLVTRHFATHVGTHDESYNWSVDVSNMHGICIDFFLPEKVPMVPLLMFQHEGVDYYIEFSGSSEPGSQENDEDYDY